MAKGNRPDAAPPRRLVCFVHLEKAAGTTLHSILRQNHSTYMSLSPFFWPAEPTHVLTARELRLLYRCFPYTTAFGGHSVRSYLGYEKALGVPIDYISVVREPVARTISHLCHQRRELGIPWTIDQFLGEPRFHNLMSRKLCGEADFVTAKRELTERFSFVGLLEEWDTSLLLLRSALRAPDMCLYYERENVDTGASLDPIRAEAEERRSEFVAINSVDIDLYRYAAEELFPSYRERYDGNLEEELATFRAENDGFRFSPWMRSTQKAYRWLTYRNVEMVLRKLFHEAEAPPPSPIRRPGRFSRRPPSPPSPPTRAPR